MGSLLISWWRPSSYKICWYSLGNIMQAHSKRDTWSTTKRNCKQLTPINIRIIRVQIQAKILFTEALTSNETLWQLLSPENARNYSNLLSKLAAAPEPYQRQQVPLSDVHEARLFNQTDVGGGKLSSLIICPGSTMENSSPQIHQMHAAILHRYL